ncbi:hypothetical protein CY35_18G006600 [Sphagnum magellanicum]|nr:hypothetical protein CY35_18G006600 [Sphagnum magellanicum]
MVGVVLVHDMEEEEEEEKLRRQRAADVQLSVDVDHQYVTLAHGPEGVGGGEQFFCGKNWRISKVLLLLFALAWVAALVFKVGVMRRSVIDKEAVDFTALVSSSSSVAAAAAHVDTFTSDHTPPESVLPYPTRRPAFHVRPKSNWISDPCGPFYFNGVYHVFYQYNPLGAYWGGNMSWGHSASTDLMHWTFLGSALEPSEWYDINGAWSGSATMVNGIPTALYSTQTETYQQLLAIAYPTNLSDPWLRKWTKYSGNPILAAPPGVRADVFRDPSAGWKGRDGKWRIALGSFFGVRDGVALVFRSDDFIHWEYQKKPMFFGHDMGNLECLDFYTVVPLGQPASADKNTDSNLEIVTKYLFKVSLQDERHDWYGLGDYDEENDIFLPDDPDNPIGLKYNHGKFFASKSFFDPIGLRRIIWGYVNESDPEANDILKGWNTILGIPRTVWLDSATKSSIITLPVDEVKSLRHNKVSKKEIQLAPGTVVQVDGAIGDQLDIEIVFDYPDVSKAFKDKGGTFGPFGLLVLADKEFQEQSALYFHISYRQNEGWITQYVSDPGRSTLAKDIDTTSYSAPVNVLSSENFLSARILVDCSVIESFVQGGRMSMNTRSYPTVAYGSNAYVYLFNNGTTPINLRSLEVWQMHSASNDESV